jgi:hypothetical protein
LLPEYIARDLLGGARFLGERNHVLDEHTYPSLLCPDASGKVSNLGRQLDQGAATGCTGRNLVGDQSC